MFYVFVVTLVHCKSYFFIYLPCKKIYVK